MNDIDRSVDSFDFAMRRRFRFVELRADERLEMLANLNNEEKGFIFILKWERKKMLLCGSIVVRLMRRM